MYSQRDKRTADVDELILKWQYRELSLYVHVENCIKMIRNTVMIIVAIITVVIVARWLGGVMVRTLDL